MIDLTAPSRLRTVRRTLLGPYAIALAALALSIVAVLK
jgi:hypothetical protein